MRELFFWLQLFVRTVNLKWSVFTRKETTLIELDIYT